MIPLSTSKVSRIQKEINEFYIKNKEMFESDIESFCRNCVAHLKKKYTTKTFIGNRHGEYYYYIHPEHEDFVIESFFGGYIPVTGGFELQYLKGLIKGEKYINLGGCV
jgi:hypothetical protein